MMTMLNKVMPPTYFFIAVIACIGIHFVLPGSGFLFFPWNMSGLILIIAGAVLNVVADQVLKKANTTVRPFEESANLVTGGVFRISRNPMYLGMILILTGVSLILGSVSPFLIVVIFAVVIYYRFITSEEKMLAEKFKADWQQYKGCVRRWI